VSEYTGTREIVNIIDSSLIKPLDERKIADGIMNYMSLSIQEKTAISLKCRTVAQYYSEENAINYYRQTFDKILTTSHENQSPSTS